MCLDCFCFRGSDSEGWKEFISKPSLPYVLRMLTGLCSGHDSTQVFFLLLYLLYHYPFGCKIYFPIFIGIGYKNFSLLVPYSCAFSPQSWNNLLCKPYFFYMPHFSQPSLFWLNSSSTFQAYSHHP